MLAFTRLVDEIMLRTKSMDGIDSLTRGGGGVPFNLLLLLLPLSAAVASLMMLSGETVFLHDAPVALPFDRDPMLATG